MKTKELIRRLMEEDPSGELEVCVDNVDIFYVEGLPGYYDGASQILIRDETKKGYNIIGGRYNTKQNKICIHTLSIYDAISNDPLNFKVDYSELSESKASIRRQNHDDLIKWHTNLDNKLEFEYFEKWVKSLIADTYDDPDEVNGVIIRTFEKHVSKDDPLPEGGVPSGMNYITCREHQWSEKFNVGFQDGFFKISLK